MKFAHDCLEFVQPLGCTEIVQLDLLRKLSVYSVCLRRSLVEFVFGAEKPPFTESAVVASAFPSRLAGGLGSPIGKALSLEIRLKGWGQNRTTGGPADCLADGAISSNLSPALAFPSFGLVLLVSKGGWHRTGCWWWFFRVGGGSFERWVAPNGVLLEMGLRAGGKIAPQAVRQTASLMEPFRVTYRQLYQSPPSGWFCWFRKVGGTERGVGGGSFGWVAAVSKGGWHRVRGGSSLLRVVFPGFGRWVAPNGVLVVVLSGGWRQFRKVGGTE
jgi:hypothetical protein